MKADGGKLNEKEDDERGHRDLECGTCRLRSDWDWAVWAVHAENPNELSEQCANEKGEPDIECEKGVRL